MKHIIKIVSVACVMLLMSCNSGTSLQRYFVDHQGDADFVAVDLATSLLDTDKIEFSEEEKEALESIKKVNFLALPLKEKTKTRYEEEKAVIKTILSEDKYETLMRFGSNGTKAVLKYQGDGSNIDEVIVFASNQEKGLALVRVLGDDMKPKNIAKLMNAIDKGDVDMDVFKNLIGDIDID
ncbi:DUF4252 domain-containing protein [Aquimarina sp. 2201CG14-23]|uniref:DUF4252 domain-containing protein n=1 Tax=Aquimarina mycalae TaxID=3040073 RepID=UPI0024781DDB|nr:DUF4252 domain-containing protein [Aquimarina sp. 2201CG14-23]MDH7444084.1 DUF4252 domain-containing protein [Aquimarina sp. 2201CG14-23]